ncbi:hypothetical protein [Saccharothrix coeruleofusca]|uniref:Helix-turn-helix protein n=1 Tax=Saccharothrix coeruleofusca TaxID=33919 RepID=A0A918EGL9_9PSEU|nr:hypothetical protein [Saccharothrix coeruleofusca]MBP2334696.1 hypothetical protein [Saccharothrix coeruleofusca]GGP72717.1 hypothetical protein GCM10010185_52600 [Saccharothrix coeruleofusca]
MSRFNDTPRPDHHGGSDRRRFTIRLRRSDFLAAMADAGLHSEYALAKAMGINRSTVSRVLDGSLQPGAAFIGGALAALPTSTFETLFQVVPHSSGTATPPDGRPRTATRRLSDTAR